MDNVQLSTAESERIGEIIAQLKRKNPIRKIAADVLEQHALSADAAFALIQQTRRRRRWKERALAAWSLGFARGTDAEIAEYLVYLHAILSDRPSTPVPLLVGGGCVTGCFSGGLIPLLCAPLLLFHVGRSRKQNRVRREAALSLGRLGHPASAGYLALAVCKEENRAGGDLEVRQEAAKAMLPVLRKLSPEARMAYDQGTAQAISRLMLATDQPGLIISILQSLEMIGQPQEIPAVKRMLRQNWWDGPYTLRTREAIKPYAERTLAALEEKQRRARNSSVLLRAADAPTSPANSLLRPAGSLESDKSLLLRPSTGEISES